MSFLRHSKSINPMYSSFQAEGEGVSGSAFRSHRFDEFAASYSLASCSPASLASALPAGSILHPPAESVNHHLTGAGEFSTGEMGNFQPALRAPD
jgi:hypothetical protein